MGGTNCIVGDRDNVADTTGARETAQPFRDARSERIAELFACRHILDAAIETPLAIPSPGIRTA